MVKPPNHPMCNRVFHYFHHPFWGFYPYFWFNTHFHFSKKIFREDHTSRLIVPRLQQLFSHLKQWPSEGEGSRFSMNSSYIYIQYTWYIIGLVEDIHKMDINIYTWQTCWTLHWDQNLWPSFLIRVFQSIPLTYSWFLRRFPMQHFSTEFPISLAINSLIAINPDKPFTWYLDNLSKELHT